jgi:hypothetical protein
MRSRWAALTLVAVTTVLLMDCSSGAPITPTPVITSIFPDSIVAGSATFPVFISGQNFVSNPQSMVLWNGSPRTAVFNTTTGQLIVTILASDVTNSGMGAITVVNPPPGGASITAASFTIFPVVKGAPVITSLSPSSANPGTKGPFLLTINGTNFASGAFIEWNGAFRQPLASSATVLTTDLMSTDLATAGVGSVTVINPLPGGIIVSSISVDFTIGSSSAASPVFPQVVSVNATGGHANGRSAAPAISADGRFVAFYSEATNLVRGSSSGNIFLRDTCLGAANCTPHTSAVDLAADGSGPDRGAWENVAISADGRFVAFSSYAANLVPGLSDSPLPPGFPKFPSRLNVFVRDMCTGGNAPAGCMPRTEIITRDIDGERAFGGSPSLSADGRFVAFDSGAANLSSGAATHQTHLYVRDTCAGPTATVACQASTIPIPLDSAIIPENGLLVRPVISSSGRFVVYQVGTDAETKIAQGFGSDIFLRDMCLGADAPAECAPSTLRVSVAPDGSTLEGFNGQPSVSSDARFVVFESQSADSPADESRATLNVFLRDTCVGPTAPDGCIPSTKLIYSQAAADLGSADGLSAAISPSGRYISYVRSTPATALDAMGAGSLFIYDTCFGAPVRCAPSTLPISAPATGSAAQALTGDKFTAIPLSGDGHFAAFYSVSAADVTTPVSGQGDVFLTTTPFR